MSMEELVDVTVAGVLLLENVASKASLSPSLSVTKSSPMPSASSDSVNVTGMLGTADITNTLQFMLLAYVLALVSCRDV